MDTEGNILTGHTHSHIFSAISYLAVSTSKCTLAIAPCLSGAPIVAVVTASNGGVIVS